MTRSKSFVALLFTSVILVFFSSCKKDVSRTTGWEYNNPENGGFGTYWHTHDDNMDAIDSATLKAVGQTVLEVIYSER